ncbi:hypothetical protein E8E13_011531 [Curvularia kusanoi]|uniref:Uncharacterized protein n=1 Tax=Curvularia kusanoi TaxID=90978 RepID=A0A9P4TLC5_CURKU|nr:hypothetical protein E8E13_011531 [Curvularia kusanoi]
MADTDTDGAIDADTGGTIAMSAVTRYRLTSKANQPEDIAFRFLDLPIELRDMIYDYVWIGSSITKQRLKYKVYTVLYRAPLWDPDQGRRISRRISGWLLTNKQIMREGLAQLHRESAWRIDQDRWARLSSFLTIYPEANQIKTFPLQLDGYSDPYFIYDWQLRQWLGAN